MAFARLILLVFWAFVMIFIHCETGQRVTSAFDDFTEVMGQCNWYLFSTETQKMLVIFLANSQQPTTVHGFGNIVCERESMKKVGIKNQRLQMYTQKLTSEIS